MNNQSVAYQRGVDAQKSPVADPPCPYAPGTKDYTEFVRGFMAVHFSKVAHDRNM